MNPGREEPAGLLPAATPVGAVPLELSGLSVAGPTAAAAWSARSRHVVVTGEQRRGGCVAEFAGGGHISLSADGGHGVNIVVFPGLVRREFVGPRGQSTETVVCPPTLPMLIAQWTGAPSSALRVAWEPAGPTPHIGVDGGSAVKIEPHSLEIEWDDDASTRSLVVCVGEPDAARRCFAAAAHAASHAMATARGPDPEILSVGTGVEEIDDGVAWLVSRVERSAPTDDPESTLAQAVAALAVGSMSHAEEALGRLPDGSPEAVLLAGQLGRATGRIGAARRIASDHLAGQAAEGGPLLADGLDALADALRYGATDSELRELRARAKRMRERTDPGRQLPMIGAHVPSAVGTSWWAPLLRGRPSSAAERSDRPLRSLPHRFRAAPDEAWTEWRGRVSEGLSHEGVGPATWSRDGVAEAELILAFVHGLLGYAADAPSGQFHLRPAIPSHWTAFACRGLPLGEGGFGLRYRRDGGEHRFTLTPEWGSVPASLIFAPSVSGPIHAAHVDGAEAPLQVDTSGGRSAVQLQLPLDDERSVVLSSP